MAPSRSPPAPSPVKQNTKKKNKQQGSKTRPAYRAARAFYLTLFLAVCYATYAAFTQSPSVQDAVRIHTRSAPPPSPAPLFPLASADEECRLVHRAAVADQCAFVRQHCFDDDQRPYLELFYCRLPQAKPLGFLLLVSWLGLLFSTIGIAASDFFCINLSTIAAILGMSESMAGVTFLAFGNGSPDVFSTFAAMNSNSGSLAVGELFGAAGFITAVVAGSMALIRPFHVARRSFVRDVGFFVVAAGFSMVFLWDGKLRFWECVCMVVFYVVYVAFVVAWHWWLGRRRRRREKEAAARGQFLPPEELEATEEEYRDEPDEEGGNRRPSLYGGLSADDWHALEAGGRDDGADDEDDGEAARDRWLSELNSNMRLTRPGVRSRKTTISNVRPSLVGALEFQAVLKGLQKSRNIQTIPLDARRYSDDPSFTTLQQQDSMSSTSDPAARPSFQVVVDEDALPAIERAAPNLQAPAPAPARSRAVSANDAAGLQIDQDFSRRSGDAQAHDGSTEIEDFASKPQQTKSRSLLDVPSSRESSRPQSPILEVTPPQPDPSPGRGQPIPPLRVNTDVSEQSDGSSHLSAASKSGYFRKISDSFGPRSNLSIDSPHDSPRTVPSARKLPQIVIPGREQRSQGSSPATSPFPRYQDDFALSARTPSLRLPGPATAGIASPESIDPSESAERALPRGKPLKWWNYDLLPPPGVIVRTLFPTIYHWREKNWWEKCLGLVAAPSVFLLTVTLPVVENERDQEEGGEEIGEGPGGRKDSNMNSNGRGRSEAGLGMGVVDVAAHTEEHYTHPHRQAGPPNLSSSAETEQPIQHSHPPTASASRLPTDHQPHPHEDPDLWNRWLTMLQLFLAPLFCLLAIYLQSPSTLPARWLLKPTLICLLISLILLIPVLATTTPTHRPAPYRILLSLAGFTVSIAWISTVAGQVVGALKALAVILNMSDAIMGLTIFAVGNSLGDLVADVTVARLGYPVMALSACFGGPMLNILLGIGVSGSYILLRQDHHSHDAHSRAHVGMRSYHIDVENTLIVSGATLLVTLVGLLIVVPWRGWVMDRRIGWALVGVWVVSTIGNVGLEVSGLGGEGREDAVLRGWRGVG